ncbi:unnamed protein product [Sphagnum jensenii]|uniref:VTT domain-containing protein n=1 Tax=Sphagnum jensenii TaxID=128206 RepID=A0ABP0XHB2_9BRYO
MAGTVWRILIFTALLLALVFICFQMPHFYHYVEKMLTKFLVWIQMDVGPWGPLVLALAYIPCAVLALPATMLTLGGGYLFGLVFGFTIDSIGSILGATAAFWVGRTIGRSYVISKLKDYPQFQTIDLAVHKSGFKIALLLRLVPLLPYNVMNYLLSVTPISTSKYILASWIGMMPLTLAFVYVGTTIKNIADISQGGGDFTRGHFIMLMIGLVLTIVAVILVMWIAKNSLERVIEDNTPANDVVIVASESLESVDPSSELLQPLILKIDGSVLSTNGQAALLDQKPDS